jgi:hypothetical protein
MKHTILFILSFVLFCGCGGQRTPDGLPKLYPVTLQFTQEGEPCDGASVQFVAVSESPNNWVVGGSTNTAGIAMLKTYGQYPGVPEGKYKIVVSKVERESLGTGETMFDSKGENVYNLIDPSYSSSNTTSLTIEVQPEKKSYDPIELGKKIRQPLKRPGE